MGINSILVDSGQWLRLSENQLGTDLCPLVLSDFIPIIDYFTWLALPDSHWGTGLGDFRNLHCALRSSESFRLGSRGKNPNSISLLKSSAIEDRGGTTTKYTVTWAMNIQFDWL